MTIPSWFVIAMGIGTVFIGLICIVILCKILGAICSLFDHTPSKVISSEAPAPVPAVANNTASFPNRQEVIAAIGAVIAEECGVDVEAIRITSIKRI